MNKQVWLSLDSNQLTGTIPMEFEKLTDLSEFLLSLIYKFKFDVFLFILIQLNPIVLKENVI